MLRFMRCMTQDCLKFLVKARWEDCFFIKIDICQVRSEWGSQKLLQGLVSHGLSLPPDFDLFLTLIGHIIKTTWLILAVSLWGVTFDLFWKDYFTHIHGLAVYVMERLPWALDLSLWILLFFTGFPSFSVVLLLSLSITFFIFIHSFWIYFI